jgi:phosphohistidine phosphatase
MDLLIWRHAEAFDTFPDMQRELTPKGHKQANTIAAWLKPRLPKNTRILVSPAKRTQQTAKALDMPFETFEDIAPGASADSILESLGWPDSMQSVLLVGHQPTLGAIASIALTKRKDFWCIKKGNLWWLCSREKIGSTEIVLKAVISPNLISDM